MARLIGLCAAVVLAAALASCGVPASSGAPTPHGRPTIGKEKHQPVGYTLSAALVPAVGQQLVATPGSWGGNPTKFTYQWWDCDTNGLNCVNIAGATSSSYVVQSSDQGHTIGCQVVAWNNQGSAAQSCVTTGVVPSGSPLVGFAGSPTPACTTTVAVNGNVDGAFANNAVICLADGSWSQIRIDQTHTNTNVTICGKAASGNTCGTNGGAIVAGFRTDDPDGSGCRPCSFDNVTVEGLDMTDKFLLSGEMTSDTYQYNTIEGIPGSGGDGATTPAFYTSPGFQGDTGSPDFTNVTLSFNQIDDDAECWENPGADNVTFSHNVCGPHMCLSSATNCHYIQSEGLNNITIDNNAFLGPIDSTGTGGAAHINVAHLFGNTLAFDNNILWHTQAVGEIQWGDDGPINPGEIKNNLVVEDSTIANTWMQVDGRTHTVNNLTINNNTVVFNNASQGGYNVLGTIATSTTQNNISAGTGGGFSVPCGTCSSNVSSDGSAPGSGSVTGWTPNWQNTTWTPNNGSPWSAPPSNYYLPVTGGGVLSSMGYQGSIGP